MDREEQGRQPGAGNPQAAQDRPKQQHLGQMQREIGQMIAERMQAPEAPFDPERGRGHRPVIEGIAGAPELIEAVAGPDQRVGGQHAVVVPDESGPPQGQVGDQPEREQQGDPPGRRPASSAGGLRGARDRRPPALICVWASGAGKHRKRRPPESTVKRRAAARAQGEAARK